MRYFFIISLLLISPFVYGDVSLSSATRTKSVSASVGLSSAARGGGGGGSYASDPWADYWTLDGSDWLSCAHSAKLQQVGNGDMALVIGVMRDNQASNMGWATKGNNVSGQKNWQLLTGYSFYRQARIAYYVNGISLWAAYHTDAAFHSEKVVFGGNLVNDGSYIQMYYWSKQVGKTSYYDDALNRPLSLSTYASPMQIGSGFGNTIPAYGRIYFLAIYQTAALSAASMDGIIAGTVHPANLSPSFYIDFSKDVGATYLSEIGDITLTVTGTPVKGP
ncbi:MAG: hypothetical protein KAH23_04470 [Kiritimatiellae bacterium]|nr:hypothetical protein [Kiritimatiellia bacterium]